MRREQVVCWKLTGRFRVEVCRRARRGSVYEKSISTVIAGMTGGIRRSWRCIGPVFRLKVGESGVMWSSHYRRGHTALGRSVGQHHSR